MKCGIVAAVSSDWTIGVDNKLPWSYPKDLKRFKELTLNTTIIMGRLTWESIGKRVLPNRQNIIISSRELDVEHYNSIQKAMTKAKHDQVWFIGGARIYEEAMSYCDLIDLTIVPDQINSMRAIRFPLIDDTFQISSSIEHPYDDRLRVERYERR